ncbi:MAG: DUF4157 domain-containing protein [Candidatus Electrothrix sp. AUS1_2]|nr:DUF4157 domain-containing protein [Candidatus Electrothrix sp. AUS1_2]
MRMPEPQVQRKGCSSCKGKEEDEDKILQAKSVSSAGNAPAQVDHPLIQNVLSSPGQPLDAGTRSFMEPRFGQDFSGVRVHTDRLAAESARAVNARAYTVGRDVVFGEGQYVPGADEGRGLIAHELVHVGQQSSSCRKQNGDNKYSKLNLPSSNVLQRNTAKPETRMIIRPDVEIEDDPGVKKLGFPGARVCRSQQGPFSSKNCPTVLKQGTEITVIGKPVIGGWSMIRAAEITGFGPKETAWVPTVFLQEVSQPSESPATPKEPEQSKTMADAAYEQEPRETTYARSSQQKICLVNKAGCLHDAAGARRPGGLPNYEEYQEECIGETGYTGPRIEPSEEECVAILKQRQLQMQHMLSESISELKDETVTTIIQALMGEWESDPNAGAIGLDTALGLIPYVDQGLDIRDITAHIFFLSEGREYDNPGRWLGLVLTLIGVVPEIGSAIKGSTKLLIKKGAKIAEPATQLLEFLAKALRKHAGGLVQIAGDFRRLVDTQWDSWVAIGKRAFYNVLKFVKDAADAAGKTEMGNTLAQVRNLAESKLDEAFRTVRTDVENGLEILRRRFPEPVTDGPPSLPRSSHEDISEIYRGETRGTGIGEVSPSDPEWINKSPPPWKKPPGAKPPPPITAPQKERVAWLKERLQMHVDQARDRYNQSGLTPSQERAVVSSPNLESAYRGSRIDQFAKDTIIQDPDLHSVITAPDFFNEPDILDAAFPDWFDITTRNAWMNHLKKYQKRYGEASHLLTYDR